MSWEQHVQQLYALDEADPAKLSMARAFLDAIGRQYLQGHEIVERGADAEVEMRGTWHGAPVRGKIDTNFALFEWEMRAPNPTATTIHLCFDEDAIPKAGAFSGANASAWEDRGAKEKEKVFFGRGYFVEATSAELPRVLAIYDALPPEVRQNLAACMVGDRISRLLVRDGGSLFLMWSDGLHQLGAGVFDRVARGAWLLGQVAFGIARVDPAPLPPPGAPPSLSGSEPMTCSYCRSRFLVRQTPSCPNCGAPPR
ncbi:MAG: hypothetical protein KIT84_18900 [Labilithrix sp.]|nr:hypothetical protein [Labilithrix sp.]MCW5813104.1 hypothetical protein [Labilithrix sp.]